MVSKAVLCGVGMIFLSCSSILPSFAHDMWIEPKTFQPDIDAVVGVGLRLGDQAAEAKPVIRDPDRIIRFVAVDAKGERAIIGRTGRDPAGLLRSQHAGLRVLGYHSRASFIELEAKKFESYLAEEGLEHISALRAQRGQQDMSGKERYARCLKSLLAVGPTTDDDHDRVLGLPLEFVAEHNPYVQKANTPFSTRLLFEGQALAGALVEAKSLNSAQTVLSARTDAHGRVSFRLPAGGAWMLSAVHMIEAQKDGQRQYTEADWDSYWASLTFELPDRELRQVDRQVSRGSAESVE